MSDKRVLVVIQGHVQGVGFRASCQRQATALGVTGWVRNRWDGGVEALLEGPAEAVDAMVRWCHRGPPAAEVSSVRISETSPDETSPDEPRRAFNIRA
jgi:acylphosphatase